MGRKKGVPNKINADARKVFKGVFDKLAPQVLRWIEAEAHKGNEGKAAELTIRMAQHFVPKLNELTGENGGPLIVQFPAIPDDPASD